MTLFYVNFRFVGIISNSCGIFMRLLLCKNKIKTLQMYRLKSKITLICLNCIEKSLDKELNFCRTHFLSKRS